MSTKTLLLAAAMAALATPCAAQVAAYSDAGSYNAGYGGATAANLNQPVNASLRDANGNLQVVNGQFQSSTMSQQTGVQNMSPLMGSSGVGFGHSSTGTASAIGNSLNVITAGTNNTVIVNSVQTNNGNQTATVNTNGH
ncbi:MAG TPA: holdfast anchoring protein HfaA [Rhizomicrobium sp.]|nr:holdfast anchoring protein HfaA [Rhizomicrobium sp.]